MKRRDFLNSSLAHLQRFASDAASSLRPDSRVLDVGSGRSPYREAFAAHRYHAVDARKPANVSWSLAVGDVSALPVRSDSFDLAFSSQVLEHTRNPGAMLSELWRVLRPGGALWLSAPFFYAEHEQPHDYLRFTQYGMTNLMEEAGFTVESINWLEGYFGTLAYQFREAAMNLPALLESGTLDDESAALARDLNVDLAALAQAFAEADLRTRVTAAGLPLNYAVVARKAPSVTTDSVHWGDLDNYRPSWAYRTEFMADLVPTDSVVVEFGAGQRKLEKLLPNSCTYVAVDIASRGPDSIVLDLNHRPLSGLPPGDVGFLSGVIEYVSDLAGLAEAFGHTYETLILSYVTSDHVPTARRDPRWRHSLTLLEMTQVFADAGYALVELHDIETQSVAVLRHQRRKRLR